MAMFKNEIYPQQIIFSFFIPANLHKTSRHRKAVEQWNDAKAFFQWAWYSSHLVSTSFKLWKRHRHSSQLTAQTFIRAVRDVGLATVYDGGLATVYDGGLATVYDGGLATVPSGFRKDGFLWRLCSAIFLNQYILNCNAVWLKIFQCSCTSDSQTVLRG